MKQLNLQEVSQYVENHIGEFHDSRLAKVKDLTLADILLSKNPYLFKAKNISKASELIESVTSAFISSSEESAFGNWMERLAIFINKSVYTGRKADGEGIDLDFDRDGKRYLVAIKSGPNWGNDPQIKKLVDQFLTIKKRLHTSGAREELIFVNGCCYGRSRESTELKKGIYFKICGQRFWELISGDPNLYLELIQPLSVEAEIKNKEFRDSYDTLINRLLAEFLNGFCDDGVINWEKLLRYNSEAMKEKPKKEIKIIASK
jgi:hypothetical protein